MIIAIYDLVVSHIPEVLEIVDCHSKFNFKLDEHTFPMSDITLEYIYIGF